MIDGSILDGKITFWTVNFTESRKQPQTVNTGNEWDLSLASCLGSSPVLDVFLGTTLMGFKGCVVHSVQALRHSLWKESWLTINTAVTCIVHAYRHTKLVLRSFLHFRTVEAGPKSASLVSSVYPLLMWAMFSVTIYCSPFRLSTQTGYHVVQKQQPQLFK